MNNHQHRISVGSLTDFVDLAPFLLGYDPQERVVAIFLKGSRLHATAAMETIYPVAEMVDAMRPVFQSDETTAVVLLAFTEDDEAPRMLARLSEQMVEFVDVIDAATVTGSAITSTSGQQTPRSTAPGAAALGMVVAGVQRPTVTREELTQALAADADRVAARQAVTIPERCSLTHEIADAKDAPMTAERAARFGRALTLDSLAYAWLHMSRETATEALSLWRVVCTYYSDTEKNAEADRVLVMTGYAAFLSGEGTVLLTMLDRLTARVRAGVMHPEVAESVELLNHFHRRATPPDEWIEFRNQ